MSVNEVRLPRATAPFAVAGSGPPTARTVVLGDEDHTLGNALRHVLLRSDARVAFAGYAVPHPAEPVVQVRVQTTPDTTALRAFAAACGTLRDQCDIVLDRLEARLPEVAEDRLRMEALLLEEDGYGPEDEDDYEDAEGGDEPATAATPRR